MLLFLRNDEVRSTEGPLVLVQGRVPTGSFLRPSPGAVTGGYGCGSLTEADAVAHWQPPASGHWCVRESREHQRAIDCVVSARP
jgi:hypothetical protein